TTWRCPHPGGRGLPTITAGSVGRLSRLHRACGAERTRFFQDFIRLGPVRVRTAVETRSKGRAGSGSWDPRCLGAEPPGRAGFRWTWAGGAGYKDEWEFSLKSRGPSMCEHAAFTDFIRRIRAGDDQAARE